MLHSSTLYYPSYVEQKPCQTQCTYLPLTKKRQRNTVESKPPNKRRQQQRQPLITPVQLTDLLKTPDNMQKLVVPSSEEDYFRAKSSKKHVVWLPLWIELDNNRYHQMSSFPGLLTEARYSAGAQGCVAAYECLDRALGLPKVALKTVPMYTSRRRNRTTYCNRKSTWSCEWRVHDYIKSHNFTEVTPTVDMYGGLCDSIHGVHQIYFAMELMEMDMFTVIEKDEEGDQLILKLLLNTAKSLKSLHEAGLIYCDLKPENILVRSDGMAKFGDFDRSCIPSIKLGIVGGTKGYESPERVVDSMKRSIEDDIWAFGVTILIAGTMASSPYADFSLDDFSKFEPSAFLETQCRKDWTLRQTKHLGALCDRILRVNPAERAPLDYIIAQLSRILNLGEYPPESPMLVRQCSTDTLGLPLTSLIRKSAVTGSDGIGSTSTASSTAGKYFHPMDTLDELLVM